MMKTCPICGETKEMRKNQKHCGNQKIKGSCSYKAMLKSLSPTVNCVDCGAEMTRKNNKEPRCGNSSDPLSCAGRHAFMITKRVRTFCAWCKKRLYTTDPRRKYHGSQNEIGSCANQYHMTQITRYNNIRKDKPKIKQKVYITDRAAIDSGYF